MGKEMDREDAIEYLEEKGEIAAKKTFSKADEVKIKSVEKRGRIYGDPVVDLY